ncbi:MAG: hypothetical protein PHG41_07675 [Actinomycetota bacterium]|nr:hypothetical protein [Actinomycetota bacterium]
MRIIEVDPVIVERNIDTNKIVELIIDKKYLDILEHPRRKRQKIFILEYRDYIHAAPFVIDNDDNIIIKTVFPRRNFQKIYKEKLK